MKKIFLLLFLMTPLLGFSASSNKKSNILNYLNKVSKITNKKYIFSGDLKGYIYVTKNFKLTKDNADDFLSQALFANGYTRIPLISKEGYTIISSRDVRYNPVPQYKASKKSPPLVPRNHDYFQLTYESENPQLLTEFTRSIRPFMSRYGRVIVAKLSNFVILQDTGVNIHRLYKLAQKFDNPPNEKLKSMFDVYESRNFEIRKIQASNKKYCSHHEKKFKASK